MSDYEKLEEACDIVIDAFGKSYAMYGLPDVIGRIYGVLFFADRPLGLDDIASRLKVSKATVSTNVRVLETLGNVRKVWLKGSRRDHYEAERSISKILAESIRANLTKEMDITSEAIARSKRLLSDIKDSSIREVQEKAAASLNNLEDLEQQYKWVYRVMSEMLQKMEVPDTD